MQVTLGGDRLGAGKRNKISMREYERSTHDLSYVWRSTMACGTLVPFMTEVALPGDTFDIDLDVDVLTHPTIGPLFGTYKIQLDVFQVPIRLYQGALHMNLLNIGMDMSQIKLPQVKMKADDPVIGEPLDDQQINPSCIFNYLGIRGLGWRESEETELVIRDFNAVPWLGYWDIYKNYYANKQEEKGAVIHQPPTPINIVILTANIENSDPEGAVAIGFAPTWVQYSFHDDTRIVMTTTGLTANFPISRLFFNIKRADNGLAMYLRADEIWRDWEINVTEQTLIGRVPIKHLGFGAIQWPNIEIGNVADVPNEDVFDNVPQVLMFDLVNIDTMRENILQHPKATVFSIDETYPDAPYHNPLNVYSPGGDDPNIWSKQFSQEGLGLKTYNSDLFNNWISTEWIDGANGVSEVTAIDTTGGSFTIDELNLSKKIYDMLNRIALSGGSYDDWLDAVYTHDRQRSAENPMYLGGLIRNLVFQEVISNAETANQPLGTLAGRGKLGSKHKGGKVIAKVDEPSYIMGIISITPNIDYSQGNKWDTNLKTMNDFHKPALDEIGFQDLVTDQMAWWDTNIEVATAPIFKSAGKQPAWINYMTNVNKVYGNFAIQSQQMFMVLNRRYEANWDVDGNPGISDLTTYIDPVKFNHIFADVRRDAQNFWTQIGVGIEARRKMSAKVIPNL